MKKILATLGFLVIFTVLPASAGSNATNCTFTSIKPVVINGTNAVELTVVYPTNWVSRTIQVSSDLRSANNWRGLMLSEQVVPKVNSPAGELPKWTRWTVMSDGIIGPRFFRLYTIL